MKQWTRSHEVKDDGTSYSLLHSNYSFISDRLHRSSASEAPTVPPQVSSYVVDSYVRLRKVSKDEEAQNKSHTYTSARTLLGVLRLAQALARLRFSDTVEHDDVDEALRLMDVSKESLMEDAEKEYEPDQSAVSQIYRLIKTMASGGGGGEDRQPRRSKRRRLGKGPGRERDMDVDSDDERRMVTGIKRSWRLLISVRGYCGLGSRKRSSMKRSLRCVSYSSSFRVPDFV
jgi:hypothetical protein